MRLRLRRCNPGGRWTAGVVLGLLLGAAEARAAGPGLGGSGASKPDLRPLTIPLGPLGYQALPTQFLSTLATLTTVHFVDEHHVLLTFTVRSLMPRLPDAEPDDDDRNVAAELLELPSGKVLARTEWRTRDHHQYLWPLGAGRFLLRVRRKLTVLDPMRNFEAGGAEQAFRQQPLLEFPRPIGYISVAPGGDLLGVETLPRRKPKLTGVAADAALMEAATEAAAPNPKGLKKREEGERRPPVEIYFFRLGAENADGSGKLVARTAGMIGAPALISLPATGAGYLDVTKESPQTWLFDFVSHAGSQRLELSPYDTSCVPHPYFISRSEFVAFGCRGSADRLELSYFNLKGEEPWLSVLQGTQVSPEILGAPAGGRFALSRTLISDALIDADNLTADELTAQEITVMQNHDGRVLLKVQATPIQRSGQNFDLSPSGTQFAVLRGGNLEVYPLPALTGKDQKAVEEAASLAPPAAADVPVRLNSVEVKVARDVGDAGADGAVVGDSSGVDSAGAKAGDEAAAGAEGTAGDRTSAAAGAAASAGVVTAAAPESGRAKSAGSGGQAPGDAGKAPGEAAKAPGDAVQAPGEAPAARSNSEGAQGDAQTGRRKPPSLYSADYPKGQGDQAPQGQKPE